MNIILLIINIMLGQVELYSHATTMRTLAESLTQAG